MSLHLSKCHVVGNHHLPKPRVLSPLRSLRVRNEVDLVPLACEDGKSHVTAHIVIVFVRSSVLFMHQDLAAVRPMSTSFTAVSELFVVSVCDICCISVALSQIKRLHNL